MELEAKPLIGTNLYWTSLIVSGANQVCYFAVFNFVFF